MARFDRLSIQYRTRDDADLLALARGGNVHAFEAFVERHESRVYTLLLTLTGRADDAADALEDAFVGAFRDRADDAALRTPRAWLMRQAIRAGVERIHARHGGAPGITDERWLARNQA